MAAPSGVRTTTMSNSNLSENPFCALFPSVFEAESFSKAFPPDERVKSGGSSSDNAEISRLMEEVFLFTVNHSSSLPCVFLEDLSSTLKGKIFLEIKDVSQALFERLMIDDPELFVVKPEESVRVANSKTNSHLNEVCEKRNLFYLYQCFHRLRQHATKVNVDVICSTIVEQSCMLLCHPEVFSPEKCQETLVDLLRTYHGQSGHTDALSRFLVFVAEKIVAQQKSGEEEVTLTIALAPSLEALRQQVLKLSLVNAELFQCIDVLHYFTQSHLLSESLVEFSTPRAGSNGREYQQSLLGVFLSVSCLPRSATEGFPFFENPVTLTPQELSVTESNLRFSLFSLATEFHKIFHIILKQSPLAKHRLLSWIGKCLQSNSGRSKLWNSQLLGVIDSEFACDGFVLNLEGVLLQLCKPFVDPLTPRILKVDPTYCRVNTDSESIHLPGLSEETFLISSEDLAVTMPSSHDSYNFLTEIFFLTHFALRLGFKVVHEQLFKLSQELGRVQRLYEESRAQGVESTEVQNIEVRMERGMTHFLSIKTALLEPQTLEVMQAFHVATATLLTQVAINHDLLVLREVKLPLPEDVPPLLYCIPEFIVENVTDCVIFMKHFNAKTLGVPCLFGHMMTLIIVFMGSPNRMRNPHLRANLAEMLEALMPAQDIQSALFAVANVEPLFVEHPLVSELVPTLLHVFVSIEMTGQSVAFEQKFQYRRPMYVVLDFLWNIEKHKARMKELAVKAETEIESDVPPLFLKFINLLMNDAIFLLDEALSSMSQLREQQSERSQWASLPPPQRHQREANLQHMGLLARFYNVMGNETIHTLEWLTSEIQSIFCHPTIVDRMAGMLNYFLYHLVGPKKKNLKVKDLGEYEFKPQELVRDICRIYLHLGGERSPTSRAFCSAVSRDGRSYSPELFSLAQGVLQKISQSFLSVELETVSNYVRKLATEYQKEEEVLADAPEEFLDPIMNTVMADPVRLPSSGITIDRATIARHLLSDQTDPFNRSHLSMEMVVPNAELKDRINKWILERRPKQ